VSLLGILTGAPITGTLQTAADHTVGKVVSKVVGKVVGGAASAVANTGLDAIAGWVLDGTKSALEEVAHLIGTTTSPDLTASWFSSTYWRVAGLAALLTVPFVFAAMLQAILRSDLALIGKVVFAYLPVSLLSVSLAAPVVMLLLSATDQMCSVVSSAAVDGGASFLDQAAAFAGGLSTLDGSPFFAVMVGLFAVATALMLALELMIRAAAVYVVVLMLPLAFAAFVWPARRIWAVRLVELLISLILSKFVIVAVLSLAGSALSSSGLGVSRLLTATALLLLSTFAPWALLRILPFTELAAGAAGALRHELPQAAGAAMSVTGTAAAGVGSVGEIAMALPTRLRRDADEAGQGQVRDDGPTPGAETGTPTPVSAAGPSPGSTAQPPAGSTAQPSPGSIAQSPLGSMGEPTPYPQPDAPTTESAANLPAGGHAAAAGNSAVEPAASPKPDPLAHIKPGMRLDLSRGVWVEPDDNE
jgi:hypothetical protein